MSIYSDFDPEITISNKFPGKLWRIVNSCRSGAIGWGQNGHTVIIHQTKFQSQYLDPSNSLFKTINIGSFIRQLNLYGFRKLNALRYADGNDEIREVHEFQNDFFIRGRPELLTNLRRNVGIRRSRELAVKRRMDALVQPTFARSNSDESTTKRPRYVSQDNDGAPMEQAQGPLSESYTTCSSTPQITMQATQTGQWPVYVQWDGNSYKYVILPDATANLQQQQQQPQQHPDYYHLHSGSSFQLRPPPPPLHPPPYLHHHLTSANHQLGQHEQQRQHHQQPQQHQVPLHHQHHDYAKVMVPSADTTPRSPNLAEKTVPDPECNSQEYFLVQLLPQSVSAYDSDDSTQASQYADFLSRAEPMTSGGQAHGSQSPTPGCTPPDFNQSTKRMENQTFRDARDRSHPAHSACHSWDLPKQFRDGSKCSHPINVSPVVYCNQQDSPIFRHAFRSFNPASLVKMSPLPEISAENFEHAPDDVAGMFASTTLSPAAQVGVKAEVGFLHYDAGLIDDVDKSEMDVYIRESSSDSQASCGGGHQENVGDQDRTMTVLPFSSPNLRSSQAPEIGRPCGSTSALAMLADGGNSPRVKVLVESVPHIEIRPEIDYCKSIIKEEMEDDDVVMSSQ